MTTVTVCAKEEVREGGRLAEVTVTGKEVNAKVTNKHAINAAVVMTK